MGCSTAMEEIKQLVADGMDCCQDRFTTPVISLDTHDSNMTPLTLLFCQIINMVVAVSKVLIFHKLTYEIHFAKFLTSCMEENKGNPDSKKANRLLEAETLSTSSNRKKYMFVSADCWNLPEDGVINIQEDSTSSKVNAGNVGGTCVSLIESVVSFGCWRSPSNSMFNSTSLEACYLWSQRVIQVKIMLNHMKILVYMVSWLLSN